MRAILVTLLCGSLAGCVSIGDIDTAIQKNLAAACGVVETSHQSFLALTAIHPLNANIMATEAKAHTDAQAYCDHPETANTMTAVAAVVRLGATIVAALHAAEVAP